MCGVSSRVGSVGSVGCPVLCTLKLRSFFALALFALFFCFVLVHHHSDSDLCLLFFLFQLNICYIFKRHICIESCLGNVLPLNFANPYRQRVLIDSHVKTDSKINTRKRICNWIGFTNCRISVRYTTRRVRNYFFFFLKSCNFVAIEATDNQKWLLVFGDKLI